VAMTEAARLLASQKERLAIVHQTGEKDYEMVERAYTEAGLAEAEVKPFIHDMAARFEQADLLICRSGATTVAEVAAAGKAAIFVPFPFATDDHQRKNAEALANAGAAELLLQGDLSGAVLAARVLALASDRPRRDRMAAAARSLARPDAAKVIVDRALELAR